jgi:putative membrane protein
MQYAFFIAYGLVILIHLYIVVLEMVLWKKRAAKVFGLPQPLVDQTTVMASNQGLYNGFLVLALVGALVPFQLHAQITLGFYGLVCIIIAGVWGGITAGKKILYIQALPAFIALLLGFAWVLGSHLLE